MSNSANEKPEIGNQKRHEVISSALRHDLTLLCLNELFVGNEPLRLIKKQKPLYLRYEVDGHIYDRRYLSPASWRAKILFDLAEGKDFRVLEMDWPGRYADMFPKTLMRQLLWHSRPKANCPPVVRLYDPHGNAEMLLTRSRLCGHAVDALHNLGGAPRFQPLWVSDIIALRPMAGIEMVRDDQFAATSSISRYLQAAVLTGRIVTERELPGLCLDGLPARLLSPAPSIYVMRLLEHVTKQADPPFAPSALSMYDDYNLGDSEGSLS